MNNIKRFLLKLFIFLFTFLFIFPAIIFSVLVLGLTNSWKSGTWMLVSSLILKIVVGLSDRNKPSSRKKTEITLSNGERRVSFENQFNDQVPPSLSDIYREIDSNDYRSFCDNYNRFECQCLQNYSEIPCECCDQCLGIIKFEYKNG